MDIQTASDYADLEVVEETNGEVAKLEITEEEMTEETIFTLGHPCCDYLLKTRNKHFGSLCENSN